MPAEGHPSGHGRRVFRDIGLSVLIGPFKFLVPATGYAVLYPLIISRAGLDVLGLWSLIATVLSYITLADIGFSQLFARELGPDTGAEALAKTRADHGAAMRAYALLLLALLAAVLALVLARGVLAAPLGGVYDVDGFLFALAVTCVAGVVKVAAKLNASLLSVLADNVFVQAASSLTPVLTFLLAIAGTLAGRPIEALALGSLADGGLQLVLLRRRLGRVLPAWNALPVDRQSPGTARRLAAMIHRGRFLYLLSVGGLVREPVFRFVIGAVVGLDGVGVFDIAMRVTRSAREVLASGFQQPLYPAFAYFSRVGDRDNIARLARLSLALLLCGGIAVLGAVVALAEPFYLLWLGHLPAGLVDATRILAVWFMITILNVPFWIYLQSAGHERPTAFSLWLHAGAAPLLLPLAQLVRLRLDHVLLFWVAAGVATQVVIFTHVHRTGSLLSDAFRGRMIVYVLSLSVLFVAAMLRAPRLAGGSLDAGTATPVLVYAAVALALFGALSLPVLVRVWREFSRAAALRGRGDARGGDTG